MTWNIKTKYDRNPCGDPMQIIHIKNHRHLGVELELSISNICVFRKDNEDRIIIQSSNTQHSVLYPGKTKESLVSCILRAKEACINSIAQDESEKEEMKICFERVMDGLGLTKLKNPLSLQAVCVNAICHRYSLFASNVNSFSEQLPLPTKLKNNIQQHANDRLEITPPILRL